MPGFSNGVLSAKNVDFRGTQPVAGQVVADGQLLIGSSVTPALAPGLLTSSDSSIAFTVGHNTLDLKAGAAMAQSFVEDVGTATPVAGVLDIKGGTSTGGAATNINTVGAGGNVTVCLNNNISQPVTNAAGTHGLYSLGGSRFLHNYGTGGLATENTFLGYIAGNLTNTSTRSTGLGANTLTALTSGINNTAIGSAVLNELTAGENNTCIGFSSGQHLQANRNTAVGVQTLISSTGDDNTAVGFLSMGLGAVSGVQNTAVGRSALVETTSGGGNSCVGFQAGSGITSGTYNTSLGSQTLYVITGSYNTCVGANAGSAYVAAESSNISIGNIGVVGESNTIRIGTQGAGNGQQNKAFVAGVASVSVANTNMVTIDTTTGQLGSQSIPGATAWHSVTSATNPTVLSDGQGYFAKGAGVVQFMLPAAASEGETYKIAGYGNLWTIGQNANQSITMGTHTSATGVLGSVTATQVRDSVEIVCIVANDEFQIINAVGNPAFA
jgi:hypothetical protein